MVVRLALSSRSNARANVRKCKLQIGHPAEASRKGHPIGKRRLSIERWLAYPHVVRIDDQRPNIVEQELGKRGLRRRVGLEVPSFLADLLATARSDLLMNAPMPLANEVAKTLSLDLRSAPILLPKVPFALVWHERFKNDPAHQ